MFVNDFRGRTQELEVLATLLKQRVASLVVIKGRRRIGKSRLVEEFSKRHSFDAFYFFSGIAPTKETTAQSERNEFASQLNKYKPGFPENITKDWNDIFWLLAEMFSKGRVLILFDEISWMGSKDPHFLGKLKNAWGFVF